uniref:Glutathione peroxidase n=1 Tax=Exaiptasia diaphana TaxID=2652724 RepID=A0A913XGN7_EXADI
MCSLLYRSFLHSTKSLSSRSLYNNLRIVCLPVGVSIGLCRTAMAQASNTSIYDFEVKDIDGNAVPLEKYKGFVTLIVNVASKCGFTKKNYTQLQELHQKYAEKGLRILAFPCNQFGSQEPGSNEEIKEFAKGYGAEFDLFSKIDVNGSNADPLWVYLKKAKKGTLTDNIKWNFTKFLCDKEGVPVKRYAPSTAPADIVKDIEKELQK